MDFFKIIRSLEQFLYEAMTWLIFYPRTLWRSLTAPLQLMRYSDAEQLKPADQQYMDSLSPPLFLMLSILIAHALEIAARVNAAAGTGAFSKQIFQSHEALVIMRSLLYSLYPLLFASALLKRTGQPLDRDHLRVPFYAQCYIAAPFAIQVSLAALAARLPYLWAHILGLVLLLTAFFGYIWVEAKRFQEHLRLGTAKSLGLVGWIFIRTTALFIAAAFLVFLL